ncbi:LCP family protein [Bacillus haikouensis]|uniref:LCP family protein n=1 Tax=Bacillus haikouensis TaxID=1510468 RepID=UPI00155802C8|nr:LCP family protein [Bacillus haikouensis]NQD65921.1 LCP family protein [Bacillus haikouensis]
MMRKWTAIPLILVLTFIVYLVMNDTSLQPEMTKVNDAAGLKSTKGDKTESKSIFPINSIEKEEPVNILVVGSDQRKNEAERADVLMVAQYVPEQTTVKLISIMRDTYVEVPGYGKSKINHAYSWGGNELLKQTLRQNFDLEINHTVSLDFQDFINMMGIIFPEGVQVTVSEGMINHWKWTKEPGKQLLKGEEILQYVRFRGDIQSDFGRVDRQQEIIALAEKNIMDKIKSGNGISTAIGLVRESFKNIETSLSIDQVMKHGISFMFHPVDNIETLRIPVEGSYRNVLKPGDGQVLEMEGQTNLEALKEFIQL